MPGRRRPRHGSSFRLTVRQQRPDPVPAAGDRADGELAAPQLDPLAHADEAVPGAVGGLSPDVPLQRPRREPAAVVDDLDDERAGR